MKVLKVLILLVVIVGVVLRILGIPMNSSLLWVAAAAEFWIVSLVLVGIVRLITTRTRASVGDEGPRGWDALRTILRESLPEGVTEAVLSEARILVAALMSLTRRPIKPVNVEPGWRRFGVLETSAYGHIVTMLLLLIVLETPAVHVIVGAVLDDTALRKVVRGLLLGSNIYLAVWLIGDLRLLRESPGILLGKDTLVVKLGLRVQGSVPLANVDGAERLNAQDAKPTEGRRAIRITPQPQPNCRVTLRSPVGMRGVVGIRVKGDMLDIFVNEPGELVSSITNVLASESVAHASYG